MALKSPADSLPQEGEPSEPADSKKKRGEMMPDDELRTLIRKHLSEATDYRDTVLKPERDRLEAYWSGESTLDGDLKPRPGRSKFVSRDVRDTIMAVMPDLVEVFCGNDESMVIFQPVGVEDANAAKDATDYVNYLVRKHGGLRLFYPVLMDAMKNHIGVVKPWWDKSKRIEEKKYAGLYEDEFEALQVNDDPDVEIEVAEQIEREGTREVPQFGPDGSLLGMQEVPAKVIDCTIKTITTVGEIRMVAVPPEERLIAKSARDLETTKFWAHARQVPVGQLIEMGYDEDEVLALGGGDKFMTNEEAERREHAPVQSKEDESTDPMMREVPYAECYVRGDLDKSGVISLWHVCVGGSECIILSTPERADSLDVAEFQTVPIEHVATGKSYGDTVTDLQGLRTSLWRGMLDSLSQALFPMRAYDDKLVNGQDLLNDEPGALVRCRTNPQALIADFTTPFVGQAVLGILQFTDEVKENRVGTAGSARGLDPNALQSTTKVAADAVVSGDKKQIKLLARIIAEFGMKPLFKILLRLIVRNQKAPERIQLTNGEFVQFDPRGWNPDRDCIVNPALGEGTSVDEQKILSGILEIQEKLAAGGSPLTDDSKLYNTLAALIKLTRYKDASMFFIRPQPNQQTPPKPTPEMALAEAEKIKAMAERESAKEKHTNERISLLLKDDLERDKLAADIALRIADLVGKYGAQVHSAELDALIQQRISQERTYSELAARVQAAQTAAQPQPQPQGQPQQ